jgi:rsbT co-antagonist protein RsbR
MSDADLLDLVPLLHHTAAVLAAVRDESMLVAAMDDVMSKIVDAEYIALFFLDRKEGRLRHAFARGFNDEERRAAERTAMDRHIGDVFRGRKLLHIDEVKVESDPSERVNPRRHPVRSRLTLPVIGRDEAVGVISIGSARAHSFSPVRISLATFVASLVGVVYWNLEDLRALSEQYAVTRAQREELLRLSAPILEAAPGVLLLPLVGRLDGERAAQIAERLLRAIAERPTRTVLFDVTGVEAADEASIAALVGIIRAAGLMGASCMLSGMTPRSARQMVALGLRLPDIEIHPTVSLALAAALVRRDDFAHGSRDS